jgi:hypothetical protein
MRINVSISQKLRILDRLASLATGMTLQAARAVMLTANLWLDKSQLSRWERDEVRLRTTTSKNKFKVFPPRRALDVQHDDLLWKWFIDNRSDGLRVSRAQLQAQSQLLGGPHSNTFIDAFMHRRKIVYRRTSNTKTVSVSERLPKMRNFFAAARSWYARGSLSKYYSPIYGQFPPELRFNFDEIGLVVESETRSTLAVCGQRGVFLRGRHAAHGQTRDATVVMCLNAGTGTVQPHLMLVFAGLGKGLSASEWEVLRSDNNNIKVVFQSKAYMDSELMLTYAKDWRDIRAECATTEFPANAPAIVWCDGLGAHGLETVKEAFREANTVIGFLPTGCTDVVQLIDAGPGKRLKDLIKSHLEEWSRSNAENLRAWRVGPSDGGLTASQRRCLLFRAVSRSWSQFKRELGDGRLKRWSLSVRAVDCCGSYASHQLRLGCSLRSTEPTTSTLRMARWLRFRLKTSSCLSMLTICSN